MRSPLDLVDAQFFYPDGPAAARIARALDLPQSIKARGADISLWGPKVYARGQMLHAADRARGLLAVSRAFAEDMERVGFPHEKITVHYTGLDHELFRPLDPKESWARLVRELGLQLPPDAPLFGSVGAQIPRKAQVFVLRALARKPSAHLMLVGTEPDRGALEAFVREAGTGARVHFLGPLDHHWLLVMLSASREWCCLRRARGWRCAGSRLWPAAYRW